MKRLFYALLVACAVVTSISSCHKNKSTSVTPPPAGALVTYSNIHVVDSTQWILHSVPTSGQLYYTFTPSTPSVNVNVGDIIIGVTNGGYLCRVTSTSINGAYYILQTAPATLAEVFKSGTFTLQVPLNDPNQAGPGIYRSYSNFGLYNQYGYSVNLNTSFNIQPNFAITFAFDSASGLTNFNMATTNTTLSDTASITINGQEPYNWSKDTTFSTLTVNSTQWVTAYGGLKIPIIMSFYVHFLANGIGGAANYNGPNANTTATWVSNNIFTGGLQWTGGQWQPHDAMNATNGVALSANAVNSDINSRISLTTQIVSAFFNVSGPEITIGMSGDVSGTDRYPPGYTDRTELWSVESIVQPQVPAGVSPVGGTLGIYSQSWTSDSVFFQTPYVLSIVSGNGQSGNIITTLPNPLVVQVNDSRGNPVSGVSVTFSVTHGGGAFGAVGGSTYEAIVTGANGQAQVTLSLGPVQGAQTVTATVVDGNLVPINGAPVTFTETGQ